MVKKLSASQVALSHGYKSGLEGKVAEQITKVGLYGNYEKVIIRYTIPESSHTYRPDFFPTNIAKDIAFNLMFKDKKTILIETKGRFLLADRKKSILVKAQYPNLDLRFIFTNSKAKIAKNSKTTYAMWCGKNGFKYADKLIPEEWLQEIKGQ